MISSHKTERRRLWARFAVAAALFIGGCGVGGALLGQLLNAAGWPQWATAVVAGATGLAFARVYRHLLAHWVMPAPPGDRGQ